MVVIIANACAGLVEYSFGISRLLQAGLHYGSQVRVIGQSLRAPGLMVDNFNLGLTAAAYGSAVLVAGLVGFKLGRSHILIGLPAAVICIVLSTTRSAVVLLAVSAVFGLFLTSGSGDRGRVMLSRIAGRVVALGLVVGIPVAYWKAGLSSSQSYHSRLNLWGHFFREGLVSFAGHGLGSAGIATTSRFAGAATSDVVADNYFINFLWQAGLVGCLLLFICWISRTRSRVSESGRIYQRAARALMIGLAASFYFTETWEYISAMLVLLPALGFFQAQSLIKPHSADESPTAPH
jgi:hypothetical protein